MHTFSSQEKLLIVLIFVFGLGLGMTIAYAVWHKNDIVNPLDTVEVKSLIHKNDSLLIMVNIRDSINNGYKKHEAYRDSIIVSGHTTLNIGYDKIKNFNDSTRIKYVDSLLRAKHIRK